jgi:hypothetical protein
MAKVWVILAALAAVVLIGATVDTVADQVLGQLLVLIVLLTALMALSVALRPERHVPVACDPIVLFHFFNAQFYVVGPVAMAVWGLSQIAFFRPPDVHSAVAPLLGCVLMTAAFLAGHTVRLGGYLAHMLPEFRPGPRKLPGRWAMWLFSLGGVAGCIGWIEYQGGLLAKLGSGYGTGRSGAMFALAFSAVLVGSLLAGWLLFDAERPTRWQRLGFLALLGFQALFFGLLFGARKYLLFLFFGLLTVWLLRRGIGSLPKVRAAALAALLLVFFSVWGAVRGKPLTALLGSDDDGRYVGDRALHEGYVSGVADPFGVACLIWQIFPDQEPFRHGRTLLFAVLGFIPRSVWPEKPVGMGKELTRYYVGPLYEPYQGFSVAPTLPGDFFVNFGWPGLVLGGFLFGVICRTAVSYAAAGMRGGLQLRAARVLLPAVFVMNLGEIRGDTAQVLAANALTMLPMLVVLAVFRFDRGEVPGRAAAG